MIAFKHFAVAFAVLVLTGPALAKSNGNTVCVATAQRCIKYTQCPYKIPQPNGSGRLAFKNCNPCLQYKTVCSKYGPGAPRQQ